MNLKYYLTTAALCVLAASAFAVRQTSAVTIDGTLSDLDDLTTVQASTNSFGAGVTDLYNLRVTNDATYLYLGVSAKLDTAGGTRGLWVILDSKSGGQNALSISTGPGGAQGLSGTILEQNPDLNADYVLFLQNGDTGNRQNYFMDVVDLQGASSTYYGVFDGTANTFTASGNEPLGFQAAIDNGETAANPSGAATATKGIELRIPLSAIGTTDSGANTLQVLVGAGDGGNGFWSSQTLPTSVTPENLGAGPNFETNTYGAFGGSDPSLFKGEQSEPVALPVSLSGFAVE
jgi:hypothetical protein